MSWIRRSLCNLMILMIPLSGWALLRAELKQPPTEQPPTQTEPANEGQPNANQRQQLEELLAMSEQTLRSGRNNIASLRQLLSDPSLANELRVRVEKDLRTTETLLNELQVKRTLLRELLGIQELTEPAKGNAKRTGKTAGEGPASEGQESSPPVPEGSLDNVPSKVSRGEQ